MRTSGKTCFICGGGELVPADAAYLRCRSCGHEVLKHTQASTIINDELTEREAAAYGPLDRFKRKVLRACMLHDAVLLDIGTASGKFLYQNRRYFRSAKGIEVTRECVDFARGRLGLDIHEDISAVTDTVSVATLWHSLEHIPQEGITTLLDALGRLTTRDSRIIVSVPNAGSWQRTLFGRRFAYYDPASHLHQFTQRSLDTLMETYGFVRERAFVSVAYAAFGALQGLMNFFNGIHNYFYYRKKRGWTYERSPVELAVRDLYNYVIAALLLLPAFAVVVAESFLTEKGAVLTLCYRKKRP